MRSLPKIPMTIAALVVTQTMSWGVTQGLPAVAGKDIATTFNVLLPAVLAGPTVMLVVMALTAVPLGRIFERFGARYLMTLGSLGIALGLALMAISPALWVYYLAWFVIGIAGAACLTTAAQIALTEIAGADARRPIAAVLVFGGLATTLYWPLITWFDGLYGWRAATLAAAVAVAVVCTPIHWFTLSHRHAAPEPKASADGPHIPPLDMLLLALSIGLNGFVTGGLSLTFVALFEARAINPGTAVALTSTLGLTQIASRATDFIGGRGWNPVAIALATSAALTASLVLLLFTSGTAAAALFIIVYGLASGALALTRATMPLQLFAPAAYTRAASILALPTNFAFAAGPPFFAALLVTWGNPAPVLSAILISGLGLCALTVLVLHRRRRLAIET